MADFVLLDGGHDTELRKCIGSDFDGHPLWICKYLEENPDSLRKVCQDFIRAGSEMILTNTYQATVDGFKKYWDLPEEKAIELIKRGVTICKEAIRLEEGKGNKSKVAVMGTIGPYGAYLHDGSEYAGGYYADNMSIQELKEWHRSRVKALLEAGVDYLFFGTIPSLKEAEAFISLLKEYPGTKAVLSFSAQNETTISHGEKLSEVAQRCWELGADHILAIGVNCQHPRFSVPLLRSVREANPDIPLCVRSNTTEIFNTTTKQWEIVDNEKTLQEYCREWLDLGVKYISGCCRTSCQDIRNFKAEIEKYKQKTS